jgi:2-polyprenyl-3-methyl-5-hydroxy-6-metoxy-1,4-benzoquinol methylase
MRPCTTSNITHAKARQPRALVGFPSTLFSLRAAALSCLQMDARSNPLHGRDSDVLDPVDAYNVMASRYAELSSERSTYLSAVERVIITQIPRTAHSMLDVGSGDGVRALRIARQGGIKDIVLLEPSGNMRALISSDAEVWPIRAEAIGDYAGAQERQFDVITCLWNVLGHIDAADRQEVLDQVSRMLSPHGIFFMDLIHRYNVRSYGLVKTALRYLKDQFVPNSTNGDVAVRWKAGNKVCATHGHVFTNAEMAGLAKTARLASNTRVVLDYQTGEVRKLAVQGNLLYAFRRISASDSASVVTTTSTSASFI